MKKEDKKKEPTIAPGMNDEQILEEKATKEEIKRGECTNVTTLSYDEADPS